MNAHNPPVRQFVPDWSDPESDEAWERYASGEFDKGRIDAWARIADLCDAPRPKHLEPRFTVLPPDHGASGPHEIDPVKVAEYASALKRGACFPAVRVVDYGDSLMIVDGHHRLAAATASGRSVYALIADGEAFEDLDCILRDEGSGRRADDLEFWTAPEADEAVAELVAPLTRRQREDRRKVQERIARDRRMAVRREAREWSK